MAEITDIGNDRIEVKVTLKRVRQGNGIDDLCKGCVFVGVGDCPDRADLPSCYQNGEDYIWVEV